ncbi:MAG: Nif3-like dinuclear metal center hexameric protein [Eubacteriales bacterium]|nr:Nif3-like dinuclear metal center hexameric protein [Eubacteriales bacterium]
MTTVKNIFDYINKIAPYDNAEEWDNTGFLAGDFKKEVSRAVLSLDATKDAVSFAKGVGADLLITHHPIIFSPVKNIKKGTALYDVINSDIAVISSHTSFDKAQGGINDNLAMLLGLKNTKRLDNGIVVAGDLQEEMSIDDFAVLVCEVLGTHGLRYTDTDKLIKRVAVGGGACGEYIEEAMAGADCFVTADMKYHQMLDANENGYAVIDAGHFETENVPFLMLKERLEEIFTDVEFLIAPVENPVKEI